MNRTELAAWLDTTTARVESLILNGMPVQEGGTFDPNMVALWLESKGLGTRVEHQGTVRSLADVAKAFGVEHDTVRVWRKTGMPGDHGRYDLATIDEWRKLKAGRNANPGSTATAEMNDDSRAKYRRRIAADVRIREAEASRKERANLMALGQMVERDNVDREVSEMIMAARDAFRRIPRKLMPRFPHAIAVDLTQELEREIDGVLAQMAAWRPTFDDAT